MDFELEFDEFDGQEQDDWLMDINGVREEFDPETQKTIGTVLKLSQDLL